MSIGCGYRAGAQTRAFTWYSLLFFMNYCDAKVEQSVVWVLLRVHNGGLWNLCASKKPNLNCSTINDESSKNDMFLSCSE